MAIVLAAIFFNTAALGKLPILEGLAVVLHVFGFFAFIVIFWVMGPRASVSETLTKFSDSNDWGNAGLATLIAVVGPVNTFLGSDSAVHLSEELKDASYVLPRAMVSAGVINYLLGFITTVTLMFNLGNVQEVIHLHQICWRTAQLRS
jgi:amino acid transporter